MKQIILTVVALWSSSVFSGEINPNTIVRDVGIDQKLGAQIPLGTVLIDEQGRRVDLRTLVNSKPTLLIFVYYKCPMLCTEVLNGLIKCLRTLAITPGNEFQIVTVSIDPKETPELASRKKAEYLRSLGKPGSEKGWH